MFKGFLFRAEAESRRLEIDVLVLPFFGGGLRAPRITAWAAASLLSAWVLIAFLLALTRCPYLCFSLFLFCLAADVLHGPS